MNTRSRILIGVAAASAVLGVGAWRALQAADACGPECRGRSRSAGGPAVACDLSAFTPEERRAHETDGAALLQQVRSVREIEDGFELRMPAAAAPAISHWFMDERRCCPFLSLELRLASGADELTMALHGPVGTKDILRPVLASR
jgi:hypothetical protein